MGPYAVAAWLQLPAHLDEIFWAGVLGFTFGFALVVQELRRRVRGVRR